MTVALANSAMPPLCGSKIFEIYFDAVFSLLLSQVKVFIEVWSTQTINKIDSLKQNLCFSSLDKPKFNLNNSAKAAYKELKKS
jgi:hypothetical protein